MLRDLLQRRADLNVKLIRQMSRGLMTDGEHLFKCYESLREEIIELLDRHIDSLAAEVEALKSYRSHLER